MGNDGKAYFYHHLSPILSTCSNVIPIGASNQLGQMCGFSNYIVERTRVLAPGCNIPLFDIGRSDRPDGSYVIVKMRDSIGRVLVSVDGTSFAAPIVAACIALCKIKYPKMPLNHIISNFMSSEVVTHVVGTKANSRLDMSKFGKLQHY